MIFVGAIPHNLGRNNIYHPSAIHGRIVDHWPPMKRVQISACYCVQFQVYKSKRLCQRCIPGRDSLSGPWTTLARAQCDITFGPSWRISRHWLCVHPRNEFRWTAHWTSYPFSLVELNSSGWVVCVTFYHGGDKNGRGSINAVTTWVSHRLYTAMIG